MSRTLKRNAAAVFIEARIDTGGRVPIIRKEADRKVSHARPCYLCMRGTVPKRLMHIKPRRRSEQRELRDAVSEATLSS